MIRRTVLLSLTVVVFLLSLGATSALAVEPLISGTSFSEVTETSATLEGFVDPNGRTTEYHFEYIDDAAYRANPEAERFAGAKSTPEVEIPATPTGPQPASAPITGLDPGTTYHFRILATKPGTTTGPERVFATYATPIEGLPDGRAYEQATPVDKNGNDATGTVATIKASTDGDAVTFVSNAGIPGGSGSQSLPLYLASRGSAGWSSQGLLPPASAGQEGRVFGWLPDFSGVFDVATRLTSPFSTALLARSSADGSLSALTPYTSGLQEPAFAGASADGSVAFFEAGGTPLTPNAAPGKNNLYVWDRDSGTLRLAGALNEGSEGKAPPEGSFAGPYDWIHNTNPATLAKGGSSSSYYTQDQHAITASGDVFFTAAKTGQLYLRRNPTEAQSPLDLKGKCTDPALACTIEVSATRKKNGKGQDGSDAAGTQPAAFQMATPDGSVAFFTSSEKLTDDANTGPEPEAPAIARANLADGTGQDLTFLPARAAGIAIDDTYVYWANPEAGTIGRAELNGDKKNEEFITGTSAGWVAVDSEHIYWTNDGEGKDGEGTIGRADLNGNPASVKQDFITGAHNPQGIAVNATHIYWANNGKGDHKGVGRAEINGDKPTQLWTVGSTGNPFAFNARGVALDDTYLYFTDGRDGVINRVPLAEPKDFAFIVSTSAFDGIAVDDTYVYWANEEAGTIGRAKLNNPEPNVTELEPEFIKEAGRPQGLAADASHLYWSANQGAEPNPGNDLYRYEASTGTLTDLAVDNASNNGAEVRGLLGTSADGSYVYFAANGDLDGPGPATAGNCTVVVAGAAGACNLYLWHGGAVSFIARLQASGPSTDAANWSWSSSGGFSGELTFSKTATVSPDGRTLLFRSHRRLTGYDNEGIAELYRYRVDEPGLVCVSCNPTGEAPTGEPSLGSIKTPAYKLTDPAAVLSRNLSADGNKVFFESTDKLVASDTNGEEGCPKVGSDPQQFPACLDVYEWEAEGSGSCETPGGCIHLISTGKSKGSAILADASASGEDVFFFTRSRLVGQDEDDLFDIYDARVGGGLSSQNEVAPLPCEGEGCKPGLSPSGQSQSPGSAAFVGPANPKGRKACPKSKRRVASKGKTRCVAKKQQRQKHRDQDHSERRARR